MDEHERIGNLGEEVRRALAAGDEPRARSLLDRLLEILEPHVAWEEAGIFERLAAQGDFAEHVQSLEGDHLALWTGLDAAEDDRRGWAAAVVDVLDELDRHIYREDFGLFPGAIAVLDADDWQAIDESKDRLEVRVHGLHAL